MLSTNSRILLTGGTGSFGKEFIKTILENHPEVGQICIYSRDELKQWELRQRYPSHEYPSLRFFLGDNIKISPKITKNAYISHLGANFQARSNFDPQKAHAASAGSVHFWNRVSHKTETRMQKTRPCIDL